MPSLSVLIGGTSAVTVLLVAAITLSVSLTFGLAALRDVAAKHTGTLVALVQAETATYVTRPMRGAVALRKHYISNGAVQFSDDPTNATAMLAAQFTYGAFDTSLPADLFGYFMVDGSSVLCYPMPDGGVSMTTNIVRNGTIAYTRDQVFLRNGTRAPPGTPAVFGGPADYRLYWHPGRWGTVVANALADAPIDAVALDPPYLWVLDYGTPQQYDLWAMGWAIPIRLADGTIDGIGYASVNFDALKSFLLSAKSTPGSEVFLVDAAGYLLEGTHATPAKVLTRARPGDEPGPGCFSTENGSTVLFGTPVLHACRYHVSAFHDYPPLPSFAPKWATPGANYTEAARVELAGGTYFVAARRVTPPDTWRGFLDVLVFMPEADVVGEIVRGRDIAIAVSAAVFCTAVAASFATVHLLLHPLRDVTARVRSAAELEKDEAPREESGITEVRELQRSYYALSDELERLAAFVPQSVLAARKRMSSDEDDDAPDAKADSESRDVDTPSSRRVDLTGRSSGDGAVRSNQNMRTPTSSDTRRQRSVTAEAYAVVGLNLSESVSKRNIAVVCLDCAGFHALLARTSAGGLQRMYAAFVEALAAAADGTKGVVDAWNGDRVMLSYNAARPVAQAGRRAVHAALALIDEAASGALGLPGFVGVASGKADVGNLGCPGAMRFVTMGRPVTAAAALAQRARTYAADTRSAASALPVTASLPRVVPDGSKVVIAGRGMLADAETHFALRPADFTTLTSDGSPVLVAEVLGALQRDAHDEWLYIVGQGNDDGNGPDAEVFELLRRQKFDDARVAALSALAVPAADGQRQASEFLHRALDTLTGTRASAPVPSPTAAAAAAASPEDATNSVCVMPGEVD